MPASSISIIYGADGLSAEADERIRRHATHEALEVNFHQVTGGPDWATAIKHCSDDSFAIVVSPDLSLGDHGADCEQLYNSLSYASQKGVLVAEVYEANALKNSELEPLQPPECHVRLICGLGAAGYLLAIDALVGAGSKQ